MLNSSSSNFAENTTSSRVERENSTSTSEYQAEWMFSIIMSGILIIAGSYLLVALCIYEYRVHVKNSRNRGINRRRAALVVDKTADYMRRICLAGSVFALVRYCLEIVEIYHGQTSKTVCSPIRHTKAVLQCGAITCVYLVLWLRQRKLYRSPAIEHLSNKITRFFSGFVIVLMVVANIVTITLYLFTRGYRSSQRGCILMWSSVWTKLPGLLLFLFTFSFQFILLCLLIHPLRKHESISAANSKKELKVIKRVSIAAAVAVASTGFISLLSVVALSNTFGSLRQIAYGIDTFVSLLCILCSFVDWKERLCACAADEEKIVGTVKLRRSSLAVESSTTNVNVISQDVV